MTESAQKDLIIANIYIDIAKKRLESILPDVAANTKEFVRMQIKRLNANQTDIYARIDNNESRQIFMDEIRNADTLCYEHILLQLLNMTNEQKALAEKVIDGIVKGEVVEFVEPANTY